MASEVTSSLQNSFNSFGTLSWKPVLGVAALCVAAITLSLTFIFSSASDSNLTEGKDTAYAVDQDIQRSPLEADARLSPAVQGRSETATTTKVEQSRTKPFLNQSTQRLAQSVEARAKQRLAQTSSSGATKAPKLSKKLVAALEKEPASLSPQAKARLKAKSKSKSAKIVARRPSSQSTRSKPASGSPSVVVIDSAREAPLRKEPVPATASSAPAPTPTVNLSGDCYGASTRQSYQCRNRKN